MNEEKNIICWKCKHEYKYEPVCEYPNGPCPICCPECGERNCPMCGGFLGRTTDSDLDKYCGNSCNDCNYEHCGGCI